MKTNEELHAEAVAMAPGPCLNTRLGFGDSADLNAHWAACRECQQYWDDMAAADEAEREPALSGGEEVR